MAGYDTAGYGYGPDRAQSEYRYTPHYAAAPPSGSGPYDPDLAMTGLSASDAAPSGLSAWIGALGSVVLMVGLSAWGYSLVTRNVADVPVIRALEGAAYVSPAPDDDPGAARPPLSLDELTDGVAPPPEDTIRIAPAPVDIDPEILPGARSASTMGPVDDAKVSAVLNDLVRDATPLSPLPPAPADEVIDAAPVVELMPAVKGTMARSPRPAGRPNGLADRTPVAVAPVTDTVTFRDPADLAPGTVLVQFSAATSRAGAEADWARLSRDFPSYLRGKVPVIQTAMVGGQRYHRLRVVNFATPRDARQFCSVFMAQGQQCFLATHN